MRLLKASPVRRVEQRRRCWSPSNPRVDFSLEINRLSSACGLVAVLAAVVRCPAVFSLFLQAQKLARSPRPALIREPLLRAQRTPVQAYEACSSLLEVSWVSAFLGVVTPKSSEVTTPPPPPPPPGSERRYSRSALRTHFGVGPFFLPTASLVFYHPAFYIWAPWLEPSGRFGCLWSGCRRKSLCDAIFDLSF